MKNRADSLILQPRRQSIPPSRGTDLLFVLNGGHSPNQQVQLDRGVGSHAGVTLKDE